MGLIQTLQPIWMGVRRNFPGGGGKDAILLIFFWGCWRCNANGRIKQKMFNVAATVACIVFLARKLYTEQMLVFVSMDILTLSWQSSKW